MDTYAKKEKLLTRVERLVKLMDAEFRIPGTGIRFGLDPLLGLVPGIGDMSGFVIGAFLVTLLAKNGASGFVLARMVLNIVVDAVVGSIPVLGDVFDFAYKANQRNLALLKEHYLEGRHRGSAWKLVIPLLFFLLAGFIAVAWLAFRLFGWLLHQAGY